jgi:ankyrin repeat protein
MAMVQTLSHTVATNVQEHLRDGQAMKSLLQQLQARQITGRPPDSETTVTGLSKTLTETPVSSHVDTATTISRVYDGPIPTVSGEQDYSSVFKLDISRFRKNACATYCSCHCHRRMRRRSPSFINRFLGSLLIGYTTLPFWSVECGQESCIQRSKFSATLTYYFPTWFMKRMFSLVLMTTTFGDLGAVIKLRKISSNFAMFRLAALGDVTRMKSLLTLKADHPSAAFYGGWTPLHYAISNGHFAMCRFLLSQMADPLVEDGDNQQSALEWAWMKILGKSYDKPRLLAFQSIFTDRECLEEMGFTIVHKIVLGIVHKDLSQELSIIGTSLVDETDFNGRTPLSWAAQRGDSDAVVILLSFGANPNLATPQKVTPLHVAAEARNPTCVVPLLSAGADPNAVDHRLHTALHYACKHSDETAFITPLIAAGACVNARTDYDYTVLMTASSHGHAAMVAYLLDHGAGDNIDERGQLGRTALIFAVESNSHAVIRLLLARGSDCTKRFKEGGGPTIVHFAARYADCETLDILRQVHIRGLTAEDLEMTNFEGEGIEDMISKRMREGEGRELGEAFRRLWNSLVVPTGDSESRVEDDDEIWEEARQHWDLDLTT